jgi:two-component system cell cycle response regulator DivK
LAISAFVRLEWKLNFEVSATAPPGKAAGRPAIIDEKSPDAFRHPGFRFVNHLGLSLTAGFDAPWRVHGGRGCESSDRDGNSMTKKVMIVEDNELNMKLFRDLIEASGYDTVRTRNGLEALDLARQHRPDLILMDIQLPEVSGLEVTKWLKEDDDLHTIPVIAVTAFAMKGDEERIRQGGCEAYISKPISVPRFVETIKSYLGDA